jgi:hypothetical protein
MKKIFITGLIAAATYIGPGAETASAGFFDKLKEKAQRVITNHAEDKVDSTVDNATDTDSNTDSAKPTPTKATNPDANQSPLTTANGSPTPLARDYILVHYAPEVLDNESWLKRIAGDQDPSRRNWMRSDEFRWHREKKAIKADILEQAKHVPTHFEITPWPSASATIVLGQYDFDREAYAMTSSVNWPWVGEQVPRWLSVSPELAEKMAKDFNKLGQRQLYGKYSLDVTGAKANKKALSGARVDVAHIITWDDRIKKIDLYLRKDGKGLTSGDHEYITSLDTSKMRSEVPTHGP